MAAWHRELSAYGTADAACNGTNATHGHADEEGGSSNTVWIGVVMSVVGESCTPVHLRYELADAVPPACAQPTRSSPSR